MMAYTKHYRGSNQSSIGWEWRNKYKTIFAIVMCARDIRWNVPAQLVFSNLCRFPLRCGLISQWISWMGCPLQWVNQPFLWLWISFPSTPILFPFLIHTKEFFSHVFWLHGLPESIVCDRDPAFTSMFWEELFRLNGTSFNFSSTYHLQTDGQTEVVNCTLEMYLRCFSSPQPKEWAKWIVWAEYCYNTSIHTTTKKTPFEIVYGRPPPSLLSYVTGTAWNEAVEKELIARDEVLKELRENILLAQSRMKLYANRKHKERSFEVGEWVYLRL